MRINKIIFVILSIMVISGALFIIFSITNISNVSFGSVCYEKNGKKATTPLSEEDLQFVIKTFNGKFMYRDNPSCGFNDNTAIILEDQVFCIARDGCAKVYWKNKNQYFNISDKELLDLQELLDSTGDGSRKPSPVPFLVMTYCHGFFGVIQKMTQPRYGNAYTHL